MIIETLGHNWDIGVRACVELATQGTIFFFFFYLRMSFKKETEDRPIHKCHKNAQVRSKHQILQDVAYFCTCLLYVAKHVPIFVYRIYIDTYRCWNFIQNRS